VIIFIVFKEEATSFVFFVAEEDASFSRPSRTASRWLFRVLVILDGGEGGRGGEMNVEAEEVSTIGIIL